MKPRLRKVYSMWFCGVLDHDKFTARDRPVGIGYTAMQAFQSWKEGKK